MSFQTILLALLLSALGGDAATVTDAATSEYPYIVQIRCADNIPKTFPGLVVSGQYIIATSFFGSVDNAKIQIIDQQGVTRSAAVKKFVASSRFVYLKVCKPFVAPFFDMSVKSFSDRAQDTAAQLLFFQHNSTVLKKTDVNMVAKDTCASMLTPGIGGDILICIKVSDASNFCSIVRDDEDSPTYFWYPVIAVGTQVNGVSFLQPACNGNDYEEKNVWKFTSIGYNRNDLIAGVPLVVNQ